MEVGNKASTGRSELAMVKSNGGPGGKRRTDERDHSDPKRSKNSVPRLDLHQSHSTPGTITLHLASPEASFNRVQERPFLRFPTLENTHEGLNKAEHPSSPSTHFVSGPQKPSALEKLRVAHKSFAAEKMSTAPKMPTTVKVAKAEPVTAYPPPNWDYEKHKEKWDNGPHGANLPEKHEEGAGLGGTKPRGTDSNSQMMMMNGMFIIPSVIPMITGGGEGGAPPAPKGVDQATGMPLGTSTGTPTFAIGQ